MEFTKTITNVGLIALTYKGLGTDANALFLFSNSKRQKGTNEKWITTALF